MSASVQAKHLLFSSDEIYLFNFRAGPAIIMALQKVKGNLERMFDKNLNDLVR